MTADEMVKKAREVYNDPTLDIHTLFDILDEFRQGAMLEDSQFTAGQDERSKEIRKSVGEITGLDPTESRAAVESAIYGFLKAYDNADDGYKNKINKYLEENANRKISYTAVDMAPGFTRKQQAESMKAFDNYFQGRDIGILDGMNLGYAGMAPDGTSTIAGFREAMSKDKRFTDEERKAWAEGKDIIIDNVMFNESAGVDNGGITLEVKNEAGAIGRIYVPQSEFTEGGLSQYFYSPMFRLSAQVNKSKNMGLKTTTVDLKPGKDGVPMNLEFSFTSDGADNVKFTHGDDVMYMGTGSERFINLINDFETLGLLTF